VTNGDKTEQMVTNDDKTEQTVTNDDKQEQMVTNGDKQEQMVTNPNDVPVVGSKKKTTIDYEKIITGFNTICSTLPKASVTAERKIKIASLLKVYTLEQIGHVFIKTSKSDYLIGNKVDWKASLDWLLNQKNFIKVLEGNYDNGKVTQKDHESAQDQWENAANAVDKYYTDNGR
jgi:hypothetical protein